MIDADVRTSLELAGASQAASALVVQFLDLPATDIEKTATVRQRLDSAEEYLRDRIAELTGDAELPADAVVPQGALGQALIRAAPEVLRKLVRPGSPLAKAADVRVRANHIVPGIKPPRRKQ